MLHTVNQVFSRKQLDSLLATLTRGDCMIVQRDCHALAIRSGVYCLRAVSSTGNEWAVKVSMFVALELDLPLLAKSAEAQRATGKAFAE